MLDIFAWPPPPHLLPPSPEPLSTILNLTLHPGRLATVDPIFELVALELLIMSAHGEEKTNSWVGFSPWDAALAARVPQQKEGHCSPQGDLL